MVNDLINIGHIVRTHGLDGTLKIQPLTDFPQHFRVLKKVYLIKESVKCVDIVKVRSHKGHILLTIEQCPDIDSAQKWVGADVAITHKDLWPLKEGEYYYFQIEGLSVITQEGEYLGEVKEIFPTGSNDVYVIRKGKKELLIPAIKDVIKSIDLERKVMVIHLVEGLNEEL